MKKFFILAATLLLTSACSAQYVKVVPVVAQPIPVGSVLVNCTYKYDYKYNIHFLESNKVVYHPPAFPTLTVYQIVDIYGKHWAINEYDWLNYTCTSEKK